MAKNIIIFKQDTNSLLKRANARYEKGDYPAALGFLFKAQKSMPDDTEIGMEIAYLYGDMGLHSAELKTLIRLLNKGRDDSEVYKELIKCYFEMELYEQAFYFYKEAMELGAFDDGTLDELLDFGYESDYIDIKLRDKRDNTNLMQLSHKLMLSGDLDFAKQLMETITPDSYQYIEATNSLAVIALSSENAHKAIDYSQKTLSIDVNNVYALSHSIIAYDIIGDNENREDYTNRLLKLNITKDNELSVAAFSMQKTRNDELAVHFLEKLLVKMPYARDQLLIAAIANSNCGNKQRARELLVRANNIYPEDITIAYYSAIIIGATEKTDLEIIPTLSKDVSEEWIAELERFIKYVAIDKCVAKNIDRDIKSKIMWAFQSGDWRIQVKLADALIGEAEWERFIRDLLIDPQFDYRAKKECLHTLLLNVKKKDFNLFVTDMYLTFEPKIPPGNYPLEMREAYWQVYATLAFIGGEFDAKLNKTFKQMIKAYKGECFTGFKIDSRPISALLLYRMNMKHVFKTKMDCCEMFNCDLTDFEVYCDIFSIETNVRKKRQ